LRSARVDFDKVRKKGFSHTAIACGVGVGLLALGFTPLIAGGAAAALLVGSVAVARQPIRQAAPSRSSAPMRMGP